MEESDRDHTHVQKGTLVSVWWEGDHTWYDGYVADSRFSLCGSKSAVVEYRIQYLDATSHWHRLKEWKTQGSQAEASRRNSPKSPPFSYRIRHSHKTTDSHSSVPPFTATESQVIQHSSNRLHTLIDITPNPGKFASKTAKSTSDMSGKSGCGSTPASTWKLKDGDSMDGDVVLRGQESPMHAIPRILEPVANVQRKHMNAYANRINKGKRRCVDPPKKGNHVTKVKSEPSKLACRPKWPVFDVSDDHFNEFQRGESSESDGDYYWSDVEN